jgi:protoporphyrinogen oxidase
MSTPGAPIKSEQCTVRPHVGIVGGGVLGMYLALRLRKQGARVTLLEAGTRTGGLAVADPIGEYSWDRFYHVILLSDSNTHALLKELGLDGRMRWGVTRTGFYSDGKLHSMSNSIEFLRFPPLSLIDKLRLGATIFFASKISNWEPLENILALKWLERWSGRRVVEKIWGPLLRSKLGRNSEIASAAFIWAIIARMYAARRSGLKREMFGYVDGGYKVVLEELQATLDREGVKTEYEFATAKVVQENGAVAVAARDGREHRFDHVVLTVPTTIIADICPQLQSAERERLKSVVYQGVLCASFLSKQKLADYYVTNITDRWVPFTGVIEMTALVDKATFGGHSLVYLPCYLTQDDAYWNAPDAQVQDDFLGALEKMYPHFKRSDVVAFNVARARQVLAVSTLGYSAASKPPIRTSLPNVHVLNSAQIANGTLNVNETLGVVLSGLDELKSVLGLEGSPSVATAMEGVA